MSEFERLPINIGHTAAGFFNQNDPACVIPDPLAVIFSCRKSQVEASQQLQFQEEQCLFLEAARASAVNSYFGADAIYVCV